MRLIKTAICLTLFLGQLTLALELTQEEKEWIKKNPEVTLGSDFSWPPFDFVDNRGAHTGLSSDIIQQVSQKTGIRFNIVSDKWSNIMDRMQNGEFNGLVCAVKTPERKQYLYFSEYYASAPLGLFVRSNDEQITSLSDYYNSEKTVALNKGSYLHEWLEKNHPTVNLHLSTSNNNALSALSFGKADGYIGNVAVATYTIGERYLSNIKLVNELEGLDTQPAIAIDKKFPILSSIVNKAVADISPSMLRQFHNKWLLSSKTRQSKFTKEELQWIKENPEITVAVELDWIPFDFIDEKGNYSGLVNDYLQLIEEISGLRFVVQPDIWVTNVDRLRRGEVDMLPAAYNYAERESFGIYTDPYFETLNYLFVRNDLEITPYSSLDGVRVAIPEGYAYTQPFLDRFPNVEIVQTKTVREAVKAVEQKKADMVFESFAVINYITNNEKISSIIPYRSPFRRKYSAVHMLVNKSKPALASIIDKSLARISTEDKRRIRNLWTQNVSTVATDSRLEFTKAELDWLSKNSSVDFGVALDQLPVTDINNLGEPMGIMTEYLQAISSLINIQLASSPIPNHAEELRSTTPSFDVISGNQLPYSAINGYRPLATILSSPIVMIAQKDTQFISDLDNRIRKNIVTTESLFQNIQNTYPNMSFMRLNTDGLVLEQLSLGAYDLALLPLNRATFLIEEGNYHNLKIVGKTKANVETTFYVNTSQPELYNILAKSIANTRDNIFHEILGDWNRPEFATKTDYQLISRIIGIALVIILLFVYWNVRLFNEIKKRKLAQESLRLEKENIQLLFDKSADAQLILREGKFVACNEAAVAMFHAEDKKALIDSEPYDWSPEYQFDGILSTEKAPALIDRCVSEGHNRFEWILMGENNSDFWVDISLTAIHYNGKHAIHVSMRDINKQKRMQRELTQNQQQLKYLFDNIPLIIFITDIDGNILLANKKALNEANVSHLDIEHKNVASFYVNPHERESVIKLLKDEGVVNQMVVEINLPIKGIRSVMLSILPISYDNESAFLRIAVDVTERIETERLLNETKIAAELANRSKSEFLANMSHEIRTPMNAILGFTELINEQVKEPKLKSFISTIQSAGNTLLTLINDILDLSKIEAGKLTIEKKATHVNALFKEISDMFELNTQQKGLNFYLELDPSLPSSILIDATRLRQIIVNLIGNAVKFTDSGFIRLTAKAVDIDDHWSKFDLEIKVTDTGIGIPFNQQDNIFDVFHQSEGQSTEKYGGTGLGLSISKRLVNVMGGDISVISTPNNGSTFKVLIPNIDIASLTDLSQSKTDKSVINEEQNFEFEAANLLVVDDVPSNRELIIHAFEGSNISCYQASNGIEAIEVYKSERINLVIMDIRMPKMDGYEAAKRIKSIDPKAIVVALTASVMRNEQEAFRKEYFDDYLRKPISKQALLSSLSKFLPCSVTHETQAGVNEKTPMPDSLEQGMLSNTLIALYKTAKSTNAISDIKNFHHELAITAHNHQNQALETLADSLEDKIENFDIGGIQQLLHNFKALSQQI